MLEKVESFLGMKQGDLASFLLDFGIRIAIAVAIFIVGFWLAKVSSKALVRILNRQGSDQSLIGFMRSLTSAIIKVLVTITAITQLGVEMTSFVALLGAAGLAIGMAFSGTLSNFAGGVMILLFKPFKAGDFVDIQGEQGIVKEVLIFNTILTTNDNKVILLANGAVANGTIVNYTKADFRRVDWQFGIAYGDNLKVAKDLLSRFMDEDKRILDDQEKLVVVGDLADSAVIIAVRAWVDTEDYWPVYYAMNERVYEEFGPAGLNIPFPQMDVHVKNQVQ
ncbi:MAG: mechanosensitive ion channel protein MscS [Bacteroidetes bacterium RIFCSPHIGHO2_02_FULL_44_7]|nr:MAG: mechanosensitive ion channel protein MscS [Bacteroidetes bacterium RIFCSPHIGHO2_02_FULL_44_7]